MNDSPCHGRPGHEFLKASRGGTGVNWNLMLAERIVRADGIEGDGPQLAARKVLRAGTGVVSSDRRMRAKITISVG